MHSKNFKQKIHNKNFSASLFLYLTIFLMFLYALVLNLFNRRFNENIFKTEQENLMIIWSLSSKRKPPKNLGFYEIYLYDFNGNNLNNSHKDIKAEDTKNLIDVISKTNMDEPFILDDSDLSKHFIEALTDNQYKDYYTIIGITPEDSLLIVQKPATLIKASYQHYLFIFSFIFNLAIVVIVFIYANFTKRLNKDIETTLNNIKLLEKDKEDELNFNLEDGKFLTINKFLSEAFIKKQENQKKIEKKVEQEKEFISNLTHELKTPLSVIQGSAEAVEMGLMDTDKAYDDIKDETKRIIKIMDDLQATEELSQNKHKIEKIDLQKVLETVLNDNKNLITNNGFKLNVDIKGNNVIYFNEHLAYTVMSNYLSNAIKYSKDKNVDISLQDSVFKVTNKGHLSNIDIWEKFVLEDKSRSNTKIKGTGLGLNFVKNIAKLTNSVKEAKQVDDKVVFTFIFNNLEDKTDL